jgi:NADH dehydrogenase/NADH:ubiquinone oxidoreductase subunit G
MLLLKSTNTLILCGESFLRRTDFFNLYSVLHSLSIFLRLNKLSVTIKLLTANISTLNLLTTGFFGRNFNKIYSSTHKNNDLTVNYLLNSEKSFSLLNTSIQKLNSVTVYHGHHYDSLVNDSFIILPASTFIEKNALHFSLNGLIKENKRVYFPPKHVKYD